MPQFQLMTGERAFLQRYLPRPSLELHATLEAQLRCAITLRPNDQRGQGASEAQQRTPACTHAAELPPAQSVSIYSNAATPSFAVEGSKMNPVIVALFEDPKERKLHIASETPLGQLPDVGFASRRWKDNALAGSLPSHSSMAMEF